MLFSINYALFNILNSFNLKNKWDSDKVVCLKLLNVEGYKDIMQRLIVNAFYNIEILIILKKNINMW